MHKRTPEERANWFRNQLTLLKQAKKSPSKYDGYLAKLEAWYENALTEGLQEVDIFFGDDAFVDPEGTARTIYLVVTGKTPSIEFDPRILDLPEIHEAYTKDKQILNWEDDVEIKKFEEKYNNLEKYFTIPEEYLKYTKFTGDY